MKTNQYLVDFYNNYDEDSRLAPKHGTVEFLTTMRYIEKYLKSGDHVLEIFRRNGRSVYQKGCWYLLAGSRGFETGRAVYRRISMGMEVMLS